MTETAQHFDQAAQGRPTSAINDSRRKSPFLSSILSIVPGLGQVYVGYYQRGFIHIAVAAGLITLLATDLGPLTPLAAVFLGFFWLYNIVDAGRRATLYNEVLAGRTDIEMPQDLQTPALRGSIVGGITTALVGLVLLLHTRFDFSLDWLEEWWPAALIIFGLYLVYKAKAETVRPAAGSSDEI
jgi:LiaI-LiaF-like transmembrane region